jgi:DNA-damage-inducible protein D
MSQATNNKSAFEQIKFLENGIELWLARELMPLLGYSKWERFEGAITKAIESCKQSGYIAEDNFLIPTSGKLHTQATNEQPKSKKDYKLN